MQPLAFVFTKQYSEILQLMNTINCPKCGEPVEITQALKHQIQDQILKDVTSKHKEELEQVKQNALEQSSKKIREEFQIQLKRTQEDALEKEERIKSLIEQITELTKELRASKKEKDEVKLEMQKKLMEEEEKIRQEATKKAQEEQHSKIAEKDKQLQSALKEVEEMRRKLSQGSQQLQGEAFETEFEEILSRQYPNDKIQPVGKGIRGGDIIQEVWDSRGNYVGKLLWELKNTKTWSDGWIDKLKEDKRTINAEEAIIISEIIPNTTKIAGFKEGVWITQRNFAIPLADTMRAKLIQMYYVKKSVQAKDSKMEILYDYLSGTEFRHRVEAIVEAFTNMQEEIEKEKRYFINKWARDEKNIRMVIDNTYGMHGDLKGIIGAAIPQIKGLDLPDNRDEQNLETNTAGRTTPVAKRI